MSDFSLSKDRVFIIAEIGNNHNGSLPLALEMIDKAVELEVDCVKFQMRNLNEVYREKSLDKSGDDLGTEYVIDLLNKFELTLEEHKKIAEYCSHIGIRYLCTPWDKKSLETLEEFGVEAYKVASADLTNLPLIGAISDTNKPIILSTGMSTNAEVKEVVSFLNTRNNEFCLLHCNSTYPAPIHDLNLNWMKELKKIHKNIGYSGHERGIAPTLASVALGARVIERHFTLDRTMEGPDHAASLEFDTFKELVISIRQIEESLGHSGERILSQGEMINKENLSKSLVASKDIRKGNTISIKDVSVLSPGLGLSPLHFNKLIGKNAKRDLNKDDFFFPSDIEDLAVSPRNYNFRRPWGLPVRYHDFNQYCQMASPDFYEFHLSYSDMDLDPSDFLNDKNECGFVVHAPELFSGSHLMDLTSQDTDYLERSLLETQKVIDITRDLNNFFPHQKRPMIVANIGGFSMDEPIEKKQKTKYYEEFEKSLTKLDLEGVELIPQTMAPFPWHFGGQRYQNLFVEIEEIIDICSKLDLRMCFDVSHTSLTCNYMNLDFYEFAKEIAPFTAHLHLGDARGVNGEGLQINEGELDFKRLGKILTEGCPDASFIPEIWQGHKDSGYGFWLALERLEEYLD